MKKKSFNHLLAGGGIALAAKPLFVSVFAPGVASGASIGLLEITVWSALLAIAVEPLLKNKKRIRPKHKDITLDAGKLQLDDVPNVVVATRDHGFIEQLPRVAVWARKRGIGKVVVLLCLDRDPTLKSLLEIKAMAAREFDLLNTEATLKGLPAMDFNLVSCNSPLEDCIEHIAGKHTYTATIFTGHKTLGYQLHEIKNLAIPLCFID